MKKLLFIALMLLMVTPLFADDDKIGIYDYNDGSILSINSDGSVPITISSGTVTDVTSVDTVDTVTTITNPVEQKPHTTLGTTVITMTGNYATPIMVTAQACKRAIVSNHLGNTGDVWVGDSTVNDGAMLNTEEGTTDFDYYYEGVCLDAGEELELYVDNTSDIYLNSNDATGELVTVIWEN